MTDAELNQRYISQLHKERENADNVGNSSRAAASHQAEARARQQYQIHFEIEKAQRLAKKLHGARLYPSDRVLLRALQACLKRMKQENDYDPNIRLELFSG